MIIPRALIYVEKRNIKEFGIYDKESPNHLIYEKWLLNQTDLKPFEPGLSKRRLKVFNDAYYICTLIMMHPTNEDFASYAKERCTMPSIVFPMVYFYISKVSNVGYSNSRLLEDIKTGLKSEGWYDKLAELLAVTSDYPGSISPLEFAQRQLTPELLSEMKWYKVTGQFNKEDIWKIVRYIAKDEKEWVMMLDAIRNAVSDYEWDYNNDLDYVDDEGQWRREPRKDMSPIFQYIDELKGKYEEESLKEDSFQVLNEEEDAPSLAEERAIVTPNKAESTSKGRPKAKPFKDYLKHDTPECFMDILEDMLKDKKGKAAALIVTSCIGHWINQPANQSVINKFSSIKPSAFNIAMNNPSLFTDEKKDEIREIIRMRIRELSPNQP